MTLAKGTRLGTYEIIGPLGAGGMGEVHRAKDTRLGRDVAIKSLPAEFAQDPERLSRFEREAKLLASLSHPNIAGIYGLEEVGGASYLVLEFVEGETLRERLSRGPLPVDETIAVAKQIAAGVEAAHESGVIHRDIKPGNVMLTPSGTVKVLDFGLAKSGAAEQAGSELNLSVSPTMTHSATQDGIILGTAAYMSPEQARGRAVDKRTDIWSFGCVLYECLTGRPVFAGETVSDLIAHILKSEPDWAALPAETPPRVRRLLRRCLEKDHRNRLRDLGDARIELEKDAESDLPGSGAAAEQGTGKAISRVRLTVSGVLLVAVSALATLGVWNALHPAPPGHLVRFEITDAPQITLDGDGSNSAISPDGRMLVFVARDSAGSRLWVRSLETLDARPLEGTKDGYQPFWSPDSRNVGFFSFGKLYRVAAAGGAVEEVCESGFARGGTWNRQNTILFAPAEGPLFEVSASGGDPERITSLDSTRAETAHRFPQFLPDGRHYLFTTLPPKDGKFDIYLGELGSSTREFVLSAESGVRFADGRLLYDRNGSLAVRNFGISNLPLKGEPTVIRESMAGTGYAGGPGFSVSTDGTLAYATSKVEETRLAWVDTEGREIATVPIDPAPYSEMDISPDARMVALVRKINESQSEIWIGDLERGVVSRFSVEPATCETPRWSPDGTRIAYGINNHGPQSFVIRNVSDPTEAEVLLQSDPTYKALDDWTPDGRSLVYARQDPVTRFDVWVLPLDGDRKPKVYVKTPFMDGRGLVSPDGRWLAYGGNETGHWEEYVQPFPTPGVRYQVTKGGGAGVCWLRGGKQLVYWQESSPGTFQIADVIPGDEFRLGPERTFCTLPRGQIWTQITSDGKRILSLLPAGEPTPNSVTVVLDWEEGTGKN
jgi:Tol biopolymer transport system component/tRNA A-37 threonylcarbamoyl transferase component Bud32